MRVAGDDLHLHNDYLRNCWYVAAWAHELIDGKLLARTILDQPILLYKGDSGRAVALDDRCCHRGARLSQGRLEGDCVRCMYHGLKFDGSGACVQIPGQDTVPKGMGVRGYPIVERDSLVWIWMGEADKADENLIVDFPYLREPGWRGVPDYLHYDANYLLIVDNLADFAHLAFVHRHTLGGSEEYAFKTKPVEVERQPRGFRVKRMHMDAEVPPFHRKVTRSDARIDRWNVGTMHIPGIFFLESGFAPAGSGIERGDISQAQAIPQLPVLHARDREEHALLLELPAQLEPRTIRRSSCRCTTRWSRASTKTRPSSSSSSARSTPIRTSACTRSPPTRRWRTFAACWRR